MNVDLDAVIAKATAASGAAAPADPAHAQQRAQLARVAQEFESMLISQMLKEMRKTESWGGEDENSEPGSSMGAGFGAETFNDTMDAELSQYLAKAQGIGLSQQLLQAFDRMAGDLSPAQSSGLTMMAPGLAPVSAGSAPVAGAAQNPAYVAPASSAQNAAYAEAVVAGSAAVAGVAQNAAYVAPVSSAQNPAYVASASSTPNPAYVSSVGRVPPLGDEAADPPETVTSAFGWRKDPFTGQVKFHRGVDLAATYGQDVQAAAAGTVVFSGEQRGYGTTVMIEHADGTRTRYAHLSSSTVQAGDVVGAGQTVGHAGHSGRATGTHLHFEVIGPDGQAISPEAWTGTHG